MMYSGARKITQDVEEIQEALLGGTSSGSAAFARGPAGFSLQRSVLTRSLHRVPCRRRRLSGSGRYHSRIDRGRSTFKLSSEFSCGWRRGGLNVAQRDLLAP